MSAFARGFWAPHYTSDVDHIVGHGLAPTRLVDLDSGFVSVRLGLDLDAVLSRRVLRIDRFALDWDIPATDEVMFRVRWRQASEITNTTADAITLFNAAGQPIIRVQVLSESTLRIWNGSTALWTGSKLSTQWSDFSFSVRLDGSAGALHVRSGGTTLFSGTSLDTEQNAGPCTRIRLSKNWGVQELWLTDCVWTSTYEDWLGTPATVTFHPVESTITSDWPTLEGEATHHEAVATDDGDTSYIETSDDNDDDLFETEDPGIPSTGTVPAVGVFIVGTRPNSGSGQVEPLVQIGAGGTLTALDAVDLRDLNYGTSGAMLEANPDGGADLTGANVDDLRIGVRSSIS